MIFFLFMHVHIHVYMYACEGSQRPEINTQMSGRWEVYEYMYICTHMSAHRGQKLAPRCREDGKFCLYWGQFKQRGSVSKNAREKRYLLGTLCHSDLRQFNLIVPQLSCL